MNEKLLAARLKKRWTIEKVCEKAGISDRAYRRWEQGTHKPRLSSLDLLCQTFDMSPEELGFSQYQAEPEAEELPQLTDEQIETLVLTLGDKSMKFDPTRRDLLASIGGALLVPQIINGNGSEVWDRLASATTKPSNINKATLDHFHKLTEVCWNMSTGTELETAGEVLSTFLPKLIHIAQQTSIYQADAANLTSQGLQLTSILAAHRLDLSAKIMYCQQAVAYARVSQDPNIEVAALIQLAVAYRYAGQPGKTLQVYQEALQQAQHTSPLLRARTYAEAGEAYARYGHTSEADRYLKLAYEAFPHKPENDPSFLFADCPFSVIAQYEGLAYLDRDQPKEAYSSFDKGLQAPSPERIRIEIINQKTLAAIASRELDLSCAHLQEGTTGAIALGSQKRYDEAHSAYHQMKAVWPHEAQIKQLAELFHR